MIRVPVGFEFEVLAQPLVAGPHAGLVVLVKIALQTVFLAKVISVEGFDFKQGKMFAIIVEKAKNFRPGLLVTHQFCYYYKGLFSHK